MVYFYSNHRTQNIFLLGASYLFYCTWDWRFLFLILISTTLDFVCGLRINSCHIQVNRKIFLIISVSGNLFILGFFIGGFADFCGAVPPPVRPAVRAGVRTARRTARKATYVKRHDLNNDGVVDAKDRAIWVRKHNGRLLISYVDEDGYFLEEIDIDNDGVVTARELRIWVEKHDENGDGKVTEDEL